MVVVVVSFVVVVVVVVVVALFTLVIIPSHSPIQAYTLHVANCGLRTYRLLMYSMFNNSE